MLYNPNKVAIAGVLAWILIWLVLPVDVTGYLSWSGSAYILGCYLAFFAGVVLGRPPAARATAAPRWGLPYNSRLFWGTLAVGLFGLGLRVFDRAVLRGVEYSANAMELRETLEHSSVSVAGALGAVLYVMNMLPLVVLLISRSDRNRLALYGVAVVAFVLPVLESLAQLSRSFMLVAIGFGLASLVIARFRGNPFNRSIGVTAAVGVLAIGVASTIIFSTRLELSERRLDDSIFDSVYAENLRPNFNARIVLVGGGRPIQEDFYRTVLPNGMYYLSGMYEFTTLWDRPDRQPFAFGALHFNPVLKSFQVIFPGFADNFDEGNCLYRIGVWQTFFGPLWADFGYFGPAVMLLFGVLAERLASTVKQGSVRLLPLYVYMIVVIFFMPVVNLLISGFGLFTVASFTFFAIITPRDVDEPARPQHRAFGSRLGGVEDASAVS